MSNNHSYISNKANIHSSVKIGPFCYIGDHVTIGKNCELKSHVSILGNSKIGEENIFYPFYTGIAKSIRLQAYLLFFRVQNIFYEHIHLSNHSQ